MNKDFNIDDGHGVDDLFRDSLGNYSEVPGDVAWNRLNRKLNRKEVVDFVTFKKTKVNAMQAALVPIYRLQWFRLAAAASVILPSLFFAGLYLARTVGSPDQPSGGYYTPDGLVIPDSGLNQPDNNYRPVENNGEVPGIANPDNGNSPDDYSSQYANNQGEERKNHSDVNQNNNPISDNNKNIIQPVIADNISDLVNDPVLMNTLLDYQLVNKSDSARNHAARIVDSIINANTIIDNMLLLNNDPLSNNSGDSTNQQQGIDSGNPDVFASEPIIIIPKAFTPNSDGLNDVLFIDGLEYYPDNTFVVHDSKGKIVYNKKEYRGDWNAVGVPDGIYIYFLTYKNPRQVTITIKGVVTIIR